MLPRLCSWHGLLVGGLPFHLQLACIMGFGHADRVLGLLVDCGAC